MLKDFVGMCCVLMVATVAFAADVQVDYDSEADFTKLGIGVSFRSAPA